MNRPHPTAMAPSPHLRTRRAHALRTARMIEHRRPAIRTIAEPATPAAPVLRFDDEPMFVGSHLEAQLLQRQWRWW